VQDLAIMVKLREQDSLAEVIRGSDVRSIIAGHLHYSTTAMFAGVPVSVASATCYTQDIVMPGTRARDGAQAFNLVHVYDQTVMHSVVPVGRYSEVSYVTPAETARILAENGVVIPLSAAQPVAEVADELTAPAWALESV